MFMHDGVGLEGSFHLESAAPMVEAPEVLPVVASEIVQPDPPGTEILDGGMQAIISVGFVLGYELPDAMVEPLNEFADMLPGTSLSDLKSFYTWLGFEAILIDDCEIDYVLRFVSWGFPVILSGDIGEILGTDDPFEDYTHGERADYAFVIKSVDTSDPENPMVTLYALDGSGEDGVTIPVSQLEDAWADGGCDYLVLSRGAVFY